MQLPIYLSLRVDDRSSGGSRGGIGNVTTSCLLPRQYLSLYETRSDPASGMILKITCDEYPGYAWYVPWYGQVINGTSSQGGNSSSSSSADTIDLSSQTIIQSVLPPSRPAIPTVEHTSPTKSKLAPPSSSNLNQPLLFTGNILQVEFMDEVAVAKEVLLTPLTSFDFDIVSTMGAHIENNLLQSLSLVTRGKKITIPVNHSIQAQLVVKEIHFHRGIKSSHVVARLDNSTSLIIEPHPMNDNNAKDKKMTPIQFKQSDSSQVDGGSEVSNQAAQLTPAPNQSNHYFDRYWEKIDISNTLQTIPLRVLPHSLRHSDTSYQSTGAASTLFKNNSTATSSSSVGGPNSGIGVDHISDDVLDAFFQDDFTASDANSRNSNEEKEVPLSAASLSTLSPVKSAPTTPSKASGRIEKPAPFPWKQNDITNVNTYYHTCVAYVHPIVFRSALEMALRQRPEILSAIQEERNRSSKRGNSSNSSSDRKGMGSIGYQDLASYLLYHGYEKWIGVIHHYSKENKGNTKTKQTSNKRQGLLTSYQVQIMITDKIRPYHISLPLMTRKIMYIEDFDSVSIELLIHSKTVSPSQFALKPIFYDVVDGSTGGANPGAKEEEDNALVAAMMATNPPSPPSHASSSDSPTVPWFPRNSEELRQLIDDSTESLHAAFVRFLEQTTTENQPFLFSNNCVISLTFNQASSSSHSQYHHAAGVAGHHSLSIEQVKPMITMDFQVDFGDGNKRRVTGKANTSGSKQLSQEEQQELLQQHFFLALFNISTNATISGGGARGVANDRNEVLQDLLSIMSIDWDSPLRYQLTDDFVSSLAVPHVGTYPVAHELHGQDTKPNDSNNLPSSLQSQNQNSSVSSSSPFLLAHPESMKQVLAHLSPFILPTALMDFISLHHAKTFIQSSTTASASPDLVYPTPTETMLTTPTLMLTGPSGCGKSYFIHDLLRICRNHPCTVMNTIYFDCKDFLVSPSSSAGQGQATKMKSIPLMLEEIDRIFEQALAAMPSIVCIDHLDLLCPSHLKSSANGEDDDEEEFDVSTEGEGKVGGGDAYHQHSTQKIVDERSILLSIYLCKWLIRLQVALQETFETVLVLEKEQLCFSIEEDIPLTFSRDVLLSRFYQQFVYVIGITPSMKRIDPALITSGASSFRPSFALAASSALLRNRALFTTCISLPCFQHRQAWEFMKKVIYREYQMMIVLDDEVLGFADGESTDDNNNHESEESGLFDRLILEENDKEKEKAKEKERERKSRMEQVLTRITTRCQTPRQVHRCIDFVVSISRRRWIRERQQIKERDTFFTTPNPKVVTSSAASSSSTAASSAHHVSLTTTRWTITLEDLEQGITHYLSCLTPASSSNGASTGGGSSAEGESATGDNKALIRRFKEQGLHIGKQQHEEKMKTIRWKNCVGGYQQVKESLYEVLYYPIIYRRLYQQSPIRLPRAIMLFGPPGCGKTHIAKTIGVELFGNTHLQSAFDTTSSSTSTLNTQMLLDCSNFYYIKGPQLLNKYIGASEKMIRDLFSYAMKGNTSSTSSTNIGQGKGQSTQGKGQGNKSKNKNDNVLIFFDEFEALAPRRGRDNTGITDRIVNQLLTFIDGVESSLGGGTKGGKNKGGGGDEEEEDEEDEGDGSKGVTANRQIFIMIASSRPDLIDPALLRPGRIEKHVYLGLPSVDDVIQILTTLLKSMSTDDCVPSAIKEIASMEKMRHFTVADVKAIVDTAYLLAAHEAIEEEEREKEFYDEDDDDDEDEDESNSDVEREKGKKKVVDEEKQKASVGVQQQVMIKGDHLLKAFQETRASISLEDMKYYESIYSRFRVTSNDNEDGEDKDEQGLRIMGKDARQNRLIRENIENQKLSYR